jgi:hypothetical protein
LLATTTLVDHIEGNRRLVELVRPDLLVDRLDARLALSGHGRPFVDVNGAGEDRGRDRAVFVREELSEYNATCVFRRRSATYATWRCRRRSGASPRCG